MSDWYFVRSGRREGPVSMGFVADEIRRGRLGDEDLVWGEGLETWQRVGDLPELVDLARQTPPPLPAEVAHAEAEARAHAAAQAVSEIPSAPPEPAMAYASFRNRILAHLVDQIILILPAIITSYIAYRILSGNGEPFAWEDRDAVSKWANLSQFFMLPVQCAYYAYFESSPAQATPGKRVFNIRVCDGEGRRLSPLRAILRILLKSFTLALGFLSIFFTPRRQALHDILVNTVVVADEK